MAASAPRRKTYTAPALAKGLDILELMAATPGRLSFRQIADKLERSKSEIFRMLAVLKDRGYIHWDRESETYGMTLKLFTLAHRQPRIQRLSSTAAPAMSQLVQTIEQSCHLVICYQSHGVVVAQHGNPSDRGLNVRLGAQVPLANSCSGHVLLAFSDQQEQRRMLSAAKLKPRISRGELIKVLKRVRQHGFQLIESQQVQGVKDIGYPVFDHSGMITAALVVPFLEHLDGSHKVDLEQSRQYLAATAKDISDTLGYRVQGRAAHRGLDGEVAGVGRSRTRLARRALPPPLGRQ